MVMGLDDGMDIDIYIDMRQRRLNNMDHIDVCFTVGTTSLMNRRIKCIRDLIFLPFCLVNIGDCRNHRLFQASLPMVYYFRC